MFAKRCGNLHSVDPDNPVVRLCVEGMKAEMEGRSDEAAILFMQAWGRRKVDYDACLAAHYVARHQRIPEQILHWNQIA